MCIRTHAATRRAGSRSAPGSGICDLLLAFGGGCEPCADGESYCAPVEVEELSGRWVPDPVDEIEQANCHEECPTSYTNPDCDL